MKLDTEQNAALHRLARRAATFTQAKEVIARTIASRRDYRPYTQADKATAYAILAAMAEADPPILLARPDELQQGKA